MEERNETWQLRSSTWPGDHKGLQSDEAAASGQEAAPAGEKYPQTGMATREDPPGMPLAGAPLPSETTYVERQSPPSSRLSEKASALLFKTAVAAAGAVLLFWLGFKLLAPGPNHGASLQPPISATDTPPRGRDDPKSAGQPPPTPPRTETPLPAQSTAEQAPPTASRTDTPAPAQSSAAPTPPTAPPIDTSVPAQSAAVQAPPTAPPADTSAQPGSNTGSLCSATSQAAGLCKP